MASTIFQSKEELGQWQTLNYQVALHLSEANHIFAIMQKNMGLSELNTISFAELNLKVEEITHLIKNTDHSQIGVHIYSPSSDTYALKVFPILKIIVPLLNKARQIAVEARKTDQTQSKIEKYSQAIWLYQKVLALSKQQEVRLFQEEMNHLIQELAILKLPEELSLYLPAPKEQEEFNLYFDIYKEEKKLFVTLAELGSSTDGTSFPSVSHFMSAYSHEILKQPIQAAKSYLQLSLVENRDAVYIERCLKKAEELLSQSDDEFAYPHFLEHLNRDWLSELVVKYPENQFLHQLLLKKDITRMLFEECLKEINTKSPQAVNPTSYLCFALEKDVSDWLEHVFVPDLDLIGVKPIFCLKELSKGNAELNNFQAIHTADQAIIICTPFFKQKCKERSKAPSGVALELKLAINRFNDTNKYGTLYPIFLKGNRATTLPSAFLEDILGIELAVFDQSTSNRMFDYYAHIIEPFGSMRDVPREDYRRIKADFLFKVQKCLKNPEQIPLTDVEKWRSTRIERQVQVLKNVQERVSKNTQMVNCPLPPKGFTGRAQELQILHETCKNNTRSAITGLGGMGKSALALKYADDHKASYQFIHFMPAGTSQQIIDGLLKLADDLHIPQNEKAEERLVWLKTTLDRYEKEYLIIFDGIDQPEVYVELEKYVPERGNCLLVTSRMPEQSKKRGFAPIELKPFSVQDAVDYLLLATGSKEEKEAEYLAEKLGSLPLALTHAASYIRSRTGMTIQNYLETFDRYEMQLFDKQYLTLKKDEQTILTTWQISMEAIRQKCPFAKEVLNIFAFLSQAPAPIELFETWLKLVHPDENELELRNAIRYLFDYSMISINEPNFYHIHPLLQSIIRYQIPIKNQQNIFNQILRVLKEKVELVEENDVAIWNQPKNCMHHALAILAKKDLMKNADLNMLLEFFRQLDLKIIRKIVGRDLSSVVEKYDDISLILRDLERYEDALIYMQEGLEIRKKTLGEESIETAKSYLNIGLCLQILEKFGDALLYLQKALKIYSLFRLENFPGDAELQIVTYIAVGKVYEKSSNLHLALLCLLEAEKRLDIWKIENKQKYLKEIYFHLACCYREMLNFPQAKYYAQKALVIFDSTLNEEMIPEKDIELMKKILKVTIE